MSEPDKPVPDEFYQLVDEFILQANRLNEQWPRSRISAALMYATACYNTHNWYTARYRGMFLDNVQQLEAAREEHERDQGA